MYLPHTARFKAALGNDGIKKIKTGSPTLQKTLREELSAFFLSVNDS